jgi:Zn-dependent protease with chaperone function
VVLAAGILWNRNGWMRLGLKLGFLLPPPERLQKIAVETAGKMNVPFKQLWLLRTSLAQAFAMPGSRVLLFSERLLELLSDDEVATICAHELAHLTEARSAYLRRYIIWLLFLPWVLLKPMLHAFGVAGFLLLLGNTVLVAFLSRTISRPLEARAGSMAKSNEPDPGTYARALLWLHEDSLVPAVLATERATHPHLYDRLLAAGVTPDFPRPAPAAAIAWHGTLFSAALGLLATLMVMRLTQQH